ncbi:UDP-galactopyranose mutase [Pedobacter terrae]|uniref:UDP-galactopyranose mutase n=1 Tax=Pedobacter terrae TaxID=405671 RepID=A0A1G7NZJ7_9SPHI|nr:UDP-galactopyranose mutase [Pedobacter terrae]SDF79413.1 UDP-galactopyranose mutase [Pedobacter terrae]
MEKLYDYVIIGSGLFGSVFAHEMTKRGKKCLVIEKRSHAYGNLFCEKIENINVHKYGAHIFHTSDESIWSYVNQFVKFNNFVNSPLINYQNELYNLPFNMNTFYKLWGTVSPQDAKAVIADQIANLNFTKATNLEEQAQLLVGTDIYNMFIKGYTEKQWGKRPSLLPASIIKRIPVRFTYNNNYFDDHYQGIPIGGYNALMEKFLNGIDLRLNCDYFSDRTYFESLGKKLVFTGKIDQFFNYKFGVLEYRSLRFENKILPIENFQGNAVVNYTDANIPFTRIYEHKHFEFGSQPSTVITKEYPISSSTDREPYYPINDSLNMTIFNQYKEVSKDFPNVIFGGRLAEYKYYDMHQVIGSALTKMKHELKLAYV